MGRPLRIVGINASPRRKANTELMVSAALASAETTAALMGFEPDVELVSLGGKKISPCLGCDQCAAQRRSCIVNDDWHELARKLYDPMPQAIVFGSPVYFFNQNALGRAFMERCTSLVKQLWDPAFPLEKPDWSTTAAGAVAVGYDRNGGVEFTLTSILQWFLVMDFVTVGGFYIGGAGWTGMETGRQSVGDDVHGLEAARLVGKRVARTGALLAVGREELAQASNIDTSWRSMNAPL